MPVKNFPRNKAFGIFLLIFAGGIAVAALVSFWEGDNFTPNPENTIAVQDTQNLDAASSTHTANGVRYESPFGLAFTYPEDLRLARQYVNFGASIGQTEKIDMGEARLALTGATPAEESDYISRIKDLAVQKKIDLTDASSSAALVADPMTPLFYPDKTILLSFDMQYGTLSDLKLLMNKAEQDGLREKHGNLPKEVFEAGEISAGDGTVGVRYVATDYGKPRSIYYVFPIKNAANLRAYPIPGAPIAAFAQFKINANSGKELAAQLEAIIKSLTFE